MLDRKALRHDAETIFAQLAARGYTGDLQTFVNLENKRKNLQAEVEQLQNTRNVHSKAIGQAKSKGELADDAMIAMKDVGEQLKQQEKALDIVQGELETLYLSMPNIPHVSVPEGSSEDENKVVRSWGKPTMLDFVPKDHVALGEALGGMDFDAATKISGARFSILQGPLAKLHRVLAQFMLDTHTGQHGYTELVVPYLVSRKSLFGTAQLPKMDEDIFHISGDWDLSLIPTGEVPLTNLYRDNILDTADLPIKLVAHTPCFRSEAGSYGKDTRGMIRQHQFEKVELVQFANPEVSYDALESLTHAAETILQLLELPYQVVSLCKGDMGFASAKTYDLEVWLPGQQMYREISSCSNFESFQARRMQIRHRSKQEKPTFLHTLNGSGLAIGRALVAVLENYQQADGSVRVPSVLQPYMDSDVITVV